MADADDASPLPVAWPLLNDTALLLLLLTVLLGVYATYLVRPRPLVHPLLLGRQSELSPTREKGRSGVYRSFAAGHGPPLTVRPASALKTLANVLDPKCTARSVYGEKISNDLLRLRARNVGKGLHALFRLEAASSGTGGIVNLLPDGFDSVLLTLALASEPSPTHPLVMLSGPHLLAHALEMSPPPLAVVLPARLGPSVLEQLIDESAGDATSPTLVIVGSPDEVETSDIFRLTEERGITAIAWTDIEVTGNDIADQAERPVVGEGDVFSLRIWEAPGGEVHETPLTHVSLTAGIAGLLALFPAHKRPSPTSSDTIASCLGLDTPIGLALLFASLWSGAGFRTFGSSSEWDQVTDDNETDGPEPAPSPEADLTSALLPEAAKPTIVFLTAPHLAALTQAIEAAARRSPLYSVARRQMLADLSEGYLAREGVLEKHFWAAVRKSVLGGFASSLRAVVVVDGGLTPTLLQSARVHLATPITNLTTSAQSTTPVFLTHFHDLQTIPSAQVSTVGLRELQFTPTSSAAYDKSKRSVVPGELVVPSEGVAHTGPPAVNIEVRLEGVDDEQIEEGVEDPQGDVWIRGPGVLADGWTKTGLRAQALKNGTFSLL